MFIIRTIVASLVGHKLHTLYTGPRVDLRNNVRGVSGHNSEY